MSFNDEMLRALHARQMSHETAIRVLLMSRLAEAAPAERTAVIDGLRLAGRGLKPTPVLSDTAAEFHADTTVRAMQAYEQLLEEAASLLARAEGQQSG